jgi:hypothetical protein
VTGEYTALEEETKRKGGVKKEMYRLFVIGKKSLPEIRKTGARASERYWGRVGERFLRIQKGLQKSLSQMSSEK